MFCKTAARMRATEGTWGVPSPPIVRNKHVISLCKFVESSSSRRSRSRRSRGEDDADDVDDDEDVDDEDDEEKEENEEMSSDKNLTTPT